MNRTVTTFVVAAAMLTAKTSAAEGSSAVAEALYQQGKRLMDAGHVSEACIKFAESQRVEPATGTLLNLANCHQQEGKTATAWAEFTQAAEQAEQKGQTDRAKFARQQAAALHRQLRSLAIDVERPSSQMEIRLDQQVLGNAAWGTALPVDPGKHRIVVSAPKKRTWEYVVNVPETPGTSRVTVPALEDARPDAPPIVVEGSGDATAKDQGTNGRRNLGLIVGGAGVLALGTGIFFGVRSVLLDNQADREEARAKTFEGVSPENVQRQTDASLRDRDGASSNRTIGFIAGGVGLAAIGVGIYFLATGNDKTKSPAAHGGGIRPFQVSPWAGPGTNGASASFAF